LKKHIFSLRDIYNPISFSNGMVSVERIQKYISLFLRFLLVVEIGASILNQRWTVLFVSTMTLFATFLPYLFERNYKIQLPAELELATVAFIFAALFLGEVKSYYTRFWWWDIILHIGSGVALGLVGFLILFVLYKSKKLQARPITIAFFAFCFAVALGAIWEIFEFGMDQIFGLTMQKSGLVDTMWDLIVDTLGALFTSVLAFFYLGGKRTPLLNRILKNFVKENPVMFENSK